MKPRTLFISIALISAVGIAYQIVLMRVFTIGQWHHFASMIISLAMLGFGASGTVVSLLRNRIRGHEQVLLRASVLLLASSLVSCYVLSQHVPFETLQVFARPEQLFNLLLLYLVLAAPFFLLSTCIMLGFFILPGEVGRLYFFNMLGSGLGAILVVGLLRVVHPSTLPYLLTIPVALAYGVLTPRRWCGWGLSAALGLAMAGLALTGTTQAVRVSEYKGLSYARQYPDARVLAEKLSPLSVITALASRQIRETPGQISNYPMRELGPLPEQIGLYFDGGAVSAVIRFGGAWERLAYLDYVTSAVSYRIAKPSPKVLVLGAGGGTDVLSALTHGAQHVTAVEVESSVVDLLRGELRPFCGGLYDRPDVTAVVAEGRGFLQSHPNRYDLIQVALTDSFGAATAGVHALSESFLYTVEALELYMSRLTPDGVLAVNCWLKTPPRDSLKLFATVAEAAERSGVAEPARHLVFIRTWNVATILFSKAPFTPEQLDAVRRFCADRWFDISYCPGGTPEEANRYVQVSPPVHYNFARGCLGGEREDVYARYPFYVRPATDDRPYFFRFIKWSTFPRLISEMGIQWVPFMEWGYLALVATLIQGVLVSALIILLPLIVFARRRTTPGVKGWVFAYFALLGCAYMFLEIAFIQRFMLFLAYPIYSVTVVLTAFLVFSGVGSLVSQYGRPDRRALLAMAVAGILMFAAVCLLALAQIFARGAGWPDALKIMASLTLLAPLAFCMGLPFPIGLQRVMDHYESLAPWAWGINGCSSVVAALLATLIAVHGGFRLLVLLAMFLYLAAVVCFTQLCRSAPVDPI